MARLEIIYDFNNFFDLIKNDLVFKSRFELINIIKKTNTKIIMYVFDKVLDMNCIIKVISNSTSTGFDYKVYSILKDRCYSSIEKIYEIIKTDTLCYIICEYINGTTLDEIYKETKPTKLELLNIGKQLCATIDHLHKYNIIHRDIKLANIMMDKDRYKLYLIDFDLSKISNRELNISSSYSGTEYYIAPESFDLCIYSKKSDIWSLGICFYKLIIGKFPYSCQLNQITHLYVCNNFKKIKLELLDDYIDIYGSRIILLIKSMLEFEEQYRPTIEEINTVLDKIC
jgi:serine/threonine protein kinase